MQKKIPLVIGYGITGKSLIQYLSENHNELILVEDTVDKLNLEEFDKLGLNIQVNPVIDDKLLDKVSEIFSSPGIPTDHVLFNLASKHKIRISSDIEIFINGNQCFKILVTGTNGKTSTSLILIRRELRTVNPPMPLSNIPNLSFNLLF